MSYKAVHDSFWTDPKIRNLPADFKFVCLYLITNPHAHYSGVYYLPLELIQIETGITTQKIKKGLEALIKNNFVKYDKALSVIWVIKMAKYQVNGSKQMAGIANHFKSLHNSTLIKDFLEYYTDYDIPHKYPIDTPLGEYHTVTEEETVTEEGEEEGTETYKQIVDYLNLKAETNYMSTSEKTRKLIKARLKEGFTVDDFFVAIDKKVADWKDDPKWSKFLRPETLFSNKFEGYLNQPDAPRIRGTSKTDKNWSRMERLRDEEKERLANEGQ